MALAATETYRQNPKGVVDADGREIVVLAPSSPAQTAVDTVQASGSAAAPGAGNVLAQISSPGAGLYEVRLWALLTGTAETALANLRIRKNGAAIGAVALPSITGSTLELVWPRVTVTAGNLDVIAIAAATAGSVYNVVLTATRL